MKFFKSVFSFYINSSIHVSLAVVALAFLTIEKYEILGSESYFLFVFFGSIVAYNFVKYAKVTNLYHRRLTKSMKGIQFFTLVSLIGFIYFILNTPSQTLVSLLPFAILTFIYAVPIFPNKKNLRSIAGIKIFIIAMVWCGVTTWVPLLNREGAISMDEIIEIFQRFVFVVVLMFPFEIRDLKYDAKELATVPQKLGIIRTKVTGSVILIVFLILNFFKTDVIAVDMLSKIGVSIITLFFLWATDKRQSEYYCSFWVESIPIMWLGLYLLLNSLID